MIRSIKFLVPLLFTTLLFSCQREASFESDQPSGPGSGGTAVFTLSGSGSNCLNTNISGVYTKGTALTASNKVDIEVNVATVGTWTLNTGSVAGFYFTGTGNFTATGVQTISLTGSGNPSASGVQVFTLSVGSGSCTFQVPVAGTPTPPPPGDHLPLTANSWWSYEDASAPGDSIKRTNIGTMSLGGNAYRIMEDRDDTGIQDSVFFRKSGNDYFEYAYVDDYSIVTFDNIIRGDILFLKEGAATGATWNSAEYTGTASGQNVKLRYAFTLTNDNATVTINGKTFSNVYQVTYKSQISVSGSPFVDEGLTWTVYYAKGIGMIYTRVTDGTSTTEFNIRNYQVF